MPRLLNNQIAAAGGGVWSPAGIFTAMGAAMANTPTGLVYNASDSRYYTDENSIGGVVKIAADGTGQTRVTDAGGATFGYGLGIGPDGNVWLMGFFSSTAMMVRLTTGGTFTDDSLSSIGSFAPNYGGGPVSGPASDTNSVYYAFEASNWGRMAVSTFAAFGALAWQSFTNAPYLICLGPDNLLWTMGTGGATAGNRVLAHWNAATSTTAATANGSATVAFTGAPARIVAGPDSNIWLLYNDRFLVYSTATTPVLLNTFTFTTTTGTARDACAGPDGAMWATLAGSTNRLVRCTTTGTITEYPITTDTSPYGICAGADNVSMWFVSQTTKKFIKFT